MGRREGGDRSAISGTLQGIVPSGHGSGRGSPEEVKKHQHKHNLKHRYDVMETLGRGTYGKVKKAVDRSSGKTVAIKSIRKERITDELDRAHIQREIEIISSLRHPSIIRIHEVFESKDKIVIVMEYARGGELYDYVNDKQRLSETEARKIFRQIASAVHYCHKNGVVHRDLKLENILLDQDGNVKLADFGLSNHYHKGQLLQTYCGSPFYASPEIVRGLPYQGPEVDCWALGVLLYALVYGSMPFDGAEYNVLTRQISQAKYRRPQPPSDACALIDWMLAVRAEERATIEDVAKHWWVNWGYQETVCDCPSGQECPSPLLARFIDWQNRAVCGSGSTGTDGSSAQQISPSGSCLRKSRKENVIPQPAVDKDKKLKGILKAQSSFDATFLTHHGEEGTQSPPKLPQKGILKKRYDRESGYSSSPDTATGETGSEGGASGRRRRGILKANGKFSASLDLSEESSSPLHFSESLQNLLHKRQASGPQQSRPPSVISDDSFLSSDSFDLLDLNTDSRPRARARMARQSLCSSEEELEDKKGDTAEKLKE